MSTKTPRTLLWVRGTSSRGSRRSISCRQRASFPIVRQKEIKLLVLRLQVRKSNFKSNVKNKWSNKAIKSKMTLKWSSQIKKIKTSLFTIPKDNTWWPSLASSLPQGDPSMKKTRRSTTTLQSTTRGQRHRLHNLIRMRWISLWKRKTTNFPGLMRPLRGSRHNSVVKARRKKNSSWKLMRSFWRLWSRRRRYKAAWDS